MTSEALNDYQLVYLVNLYAAATQTPTFTTSESDATSVQVDPNNIVQVDNGHTAGGIVGDWYQYAGTASLPNVNLTTEDFTDTALYGQTSVPVGSSKPRALFRISRRIWMAVSVLTTILPTPGRKPPRRMAMPRLGSPAHSPCSSVESNDVRAYHRTQRANQPGHRSDLSHGQPECVYPCHRHEFVGRPGWQCSDARDCQQLFEEFEIQHQQAGRRCCGQTSLGRSRGFGARVHRRRYGNHRHRRSTLCRQPGRRRGNCGRQHRFADFGCNFG